MPSISSEVGEIEVCLQLQPNIVFKHIPGTGEHMFFWSIVGTIEISIAFRNMCTINDTCRLHTCCRNDVQR